MIEMFMYEFLCIYMNMCILMKIFLCSCVYVYPSEVDEDDTHFVGIEPKGQMMVLIYYLIVSWIMQ